MPVHVKTHGGQGYSVSLNGKELDLVIEADDEVGYAVVQRVDAGGNPFVDPETGNIAIHRYDGAIQINKGDA